MNARAATRRAVALASLALAFAGAASAASAAIEKKTHRLGAHPSIPSTPRLDPSLIFEDGAPHERAAGAASAAALVADGRLLYDTHCISCHGADLKGVAGVPSIVNDAGAATDFFVRTGRMPAALKVVQAIHTAPHFEDAQIVALDAYVASRTRTVEPIPHVTLDASRLQAGRQIFEANCQQCHGAAGEGATVGSGWLAPALYASTPVEVGEAIRVGPGVMPRFTPQEISDDGIDAVATYVHYLTYDSQSYGGLTMDNLGPSAEGLVGGILGVGALFWVIFFTGTKADGSRLHER